MRALVLALLCACVHFPAMEPESRDYHARDRAAVVMESHCGDAYLSGNSRTASGVVISERHVLTAAHVTSCVALPAIRVWLDEGTSHRLVVVDEDLDADIALLEVAHAGNFERGFVPPALSDSDASVGCVVAKFPRDEVTCGPIDGDLLRVPSRRGNSGAAVYDDEGNLIGVVSRGTRAYTRVARVTAKWLRGVKKKKEEVQ